MFAIKLDKFNNVLRQKEIWWHIGDGYLACNPNESIPSNVKLYQERSEAEDMVRQLESDRRESYHGHEVVSL